MPTLKKSKVKRFYQVFLKKTSNTYIKKKDKMENIIGRKGKLKGLDENIIDGFIH